MSPEQALGAADVGPESDVYALGAVLFELLTGQPPFDASSRMALLGRIVLETPPRLRTLRDDLPGGLDLLLGRVLTKEPADRPSAAELAEELQALPPVRGTGRLPRIESEGPSSTMDLPAEDERRVMVVLLAGLAGGGPMPQPMADTLASAAGAPARCRQLRDGTFLAAFGGVHTRGDETVAAARLALVARRAHPVLRFALATGLAEHDEGQAPTGEALDRAATALQQSERGLIVLDAASVTLLGSRFEVQRDGSRALLTREVDESQAPPRIFGRRSPFVGRGRELGLTLGLYREALEERAPRIVWVTGDPGMGKSRLRSELLSELARTGDTPNVVYCRGDSSTLDVAYAAVGRALRRACGVDEVSSRDARRTLAVERLGAMLSPGRHRELVPFLAELAEVHLPEVQAPALRPARNDPLLMGERVRDAFVEWIRASARVRPVVLVVEDAQDVDQDSLRLLDAVARQVDDAPVFVLMSGRREAQERLPAGLVEQSTHLELPELNERAAERLVRANLPELDAETARDVVQRSGGNPLFVEELVRVVGEGYVDVLPATVHAVLQARLDQLPRDVRAVARAASVFGGAFWTEGVAHLLEDVDVPQALSVLSSGEFVVRRNLSRLPGQQEWAYPIPVLREVAYEMLVPKERQRLHRLAAQWLDQVTAGDDAVVAPHLDRAGETREAARRYVNASVRALGAGALDAAVHASTRSLELEVEGPARTRALLTRCEARLRLAEYGAAAEDGLAAAAAQGAGEAGRILGYGFAGRARRMQGKLDDALGLLDGALGVETGSEEAEVAQLKTRLWRCSALADAGHATHARDRIDKLVRFHGEHPDPLVRYNLASARGYVAFVGGDLATTLQAEHQALEQTRQLGDALRTAQVLELLVQGLVRVGRHGLACEYAQQGLGLATTARATGVQAALQLGFGLAQAGAGHLHRAVQEVEAALELLERVQRPALSASAHAQLAMLRLTFATKEETAKAARLAWRAHDSSPPDVTSAGLAMLALARTKLAEGEPDYAEEMLRPRVGAGHPWELSIRLVHYDALRALGNEHAAAKALARAAERLETIAATFGDPDIERSFRAMPEHRRIAELAETELPREGNQFP
jgi:hypothetical protein